MLEIVKTSAVNANMFARLVSTDRQGNFADVVKKMLRLEMENSLLRAERRLPAGDLQDKAEIEHLQEQITTLQQAVIELQQRVETLEKRRK